MGVYRKIEVRVWNDKKFCSLSDDSKLLFLHFLTHPKLLQIGVIPYRSEVMALDLGWSMQRFDKAFEELFRNGMANRSERIVFITNFLRYNPPANANVVKHYNTEIEEVPECELLDEIKRAVIAICREKGEQYPKILCKEFFDFSTEETVTETVPQTVSDTHTQTVCEINNNNNNNSNSNNNNNNTIGPSDFDDLAIVAQECEQEVPEGYDDLMLIAEGVKLPKIADRCPYQQIVELYHELLPELPRVKIALLSSKRKSHIKARWQFLTKNDEAKTVEEGLTCFRNYFTVVRKQPFLWNGNNDRGWRADLDWLMNESNFVKVLEYRYDRQKHLRQ